MDTQQQRRTEGDATLARRTAGLERMLARMERARARRGRPAPIVLVEAPGWRFAWGAAERPMHPASCGKLVTTTLIGQLVDEGRIAFDTTLGALLPEADTRGLPMPSGSDPRAITVEQLLANRSGLPDYFEAGGSSAASFRSAVRHPERSFTPADLIDAARTQRPVAAPGARFHYSDTNWVLLGRIVEEATGETFFDRARTRVFEPVGMPSAWTPYDPRVMPDDLSGIEVEPFWVLGHELSRARSVSLDFAGGNVVATPEDWTRFLRAMFEGDLLRPETLAQLVRGRSRFRWGMGYGAGTMALHWRRLAPFMRGPAPIALGHLGFWAAHTFHYPKQRAQVVLNFHEPRAMQASFLVHGTIAGILASLE